MARSASSSAALRSVLVGALMASSADAFALRTRPNSAMTTRRTALFAAKDAPTPVMEVPLSEIEVEQLQAAWANAIKTCSKIYLEKGDYVSAAAGAAGELYGYGHHPVLFKPTKAKAYPFRPTAGEAMSYFVGGEVVDGGYKEDGGFAINGGKGFSKVIFTNHNIDINGPMAIAMGSYVFTCATTGDESRVEYTFGYKRCADGKARIFLHHSSVPYAMPAAATKEKKVEEKEEAAPVAEEAKEEEKEEEKKPEKKSGRKNLKEILGLNA
jgi:hypothetical protein